MQNQCSRREGQKYGFLCTAPHVPPNSYVVMAFYILKMDKTSTGTVKKMENENKNEKCNLTSKIDADKTENVET